MQLTSYYSTGAVRLTKADDKSAEKTEKTTSKLKVGKEKPPGKSISMRSGKGWGNAPFFLLLKCGVKSL